MNAPCHLLRGCGRSLVSGARCRRVYDTANREGHFVLFGRIHSGLGQMSSPTLVSCHNPEESSLVDTDIYPRPTNRPDSIGTDASIAVTPVLKCLYGRRKRRTVADSLLVRGDHRECARARQGFSWSGTSEPFRSDLLPTPGGVVLPPAAFSQVAFASRLISRQLRGSASVAPLLGLAASHE